MSVDERKEKARAIYDMLQTPGWRLVEDYMNRRRQDIMDRLRLDDLDQPLKIGRLQGEMQAYHNLHGHIQKILRAGQPAPKEG